MKQLFSILFLSVALSVQAKILTVSSNPSTIAQFSTIQDAISAASSGDSIYVEGSPNTYAAFTISDISVTIIGPGFSPDKNLPLGANVAGCTITGSASSNTEIQGMTFNSTIVINSNKPDNISFIRNHFNNISMQLLQGNTTYTGYLFESNVFNNSSVDANSSSTYQNFLFEDNYFYESGCCRNGNINNFLNSVNVLFSHNLWFGPSSNTRNVTGSSSRFLTFSDNIFVRRDASSNISLSSFNNNITFNAGVNNPWAVNSNTDGGGNVENQDPQMADETAVNNGTNNLTGDYTIASGPANNTGSDGKDMGLLYDGTGSLNWNNSRNSRLPRIFSMNVVSPTVPAGGNVSINVNARVSN